MATAFERLFGKIAEITAIMESSKDKETAVNRIIAEMPEFADMKTGTVSSYITNFPFIFKTLVSEMISIRAKLETVKQETEKEFQTVIDNVKQENETLRHELENLRQNLDKSLEIEQQLDKAKNENETLIHELDKLRHELSKGTEIAQENETLRHELENFRQNLDKGAGDMELAKELQDLKNRVTAIELSLDKNVSKLDNSLDKNVSNLDTPEYVDGWRCVLKNGYYMLYKSINKKLIWIHLGRQFNLEKAQRKIQERVSKLDKSSDNSLDKKNI